MEHGIGQLFVDCPLCIDQSASPLGEPARREWRSDDVVGPPGWPNLQAAPKGSGPSAFSVTSQARLGDTELDSGGNEGYGCALMSDDLTSGQSWRGKFWLPDKPDETHEGFVT